MFHSDLISVISTHQAKGTFFSATLEITISLLQRRNIHACLLIKFMGKKVKWSWTSAFIGAASATAVTALLSAKPKDPTFHLFSIDFTSFKLNLPVLDAELLLTVHVTNPNITPVHYSSTTMSIFYDGSLLGSAQVEAGSQPSRSCKLLRLQARLDGLQLAHHASKFFSDVAKREMVLDAKVDVEGAAKVVLWEHKFKVHVDSHVTVDPLFLDVIDQENKSQLDLLFA
ncbi:uncharacterized protein LOC110663132 [Hevea brasiliensis]|uniref:uncharacterized protein LOC110663132 n=1 Tax=Hevea brasiliensis TaxID=3981 RepID=UPI0025E82E64|nr:uncharacterized protein LOC110663132 [Hevea brasiliensis]